MMLNTFGKWFVLLAALLGVVLGRVCLDWATRMHWVDRPGHRKSHKRPVPYLGGMALFASMVLTVPILTFLCGVSELPGFSLSSLLWCFLPALGASALGLWDDLFDMPARVKFIGQGGLALLFSLFAYRFSVIHIPGFAPIGLDPAVAAVVTTFFILAIVNGFNMIDGSDALCLSASITALFWIALLTQWQGQPHLVALSLAGCGACLGLLYWNKPPARMYGGDAGSQGLGFLVACMLVAAGAGEPGQFFNDLSAAASRQPFRFQIVVACLLAGVPALEVFLTVARRGLQGRPLGRADQGHLHHRLARLGLKPRGVAIVAAINNIVIAAIILAVLSGHKGLAVLVIIGQVALWVLGLQKLGYGRIFQRRWLDDRRPHFAVANHFTNMQIAKLKLATNRDEVLALVAQACHEFGVLECRITLRDRTNTYRLWTWAWQDPAPLPVPARLRHLPHIADRARLPGRRNHAVWTLVNDEREYELTMDMRVLMVEFMARALERLVGLAPEVVDNPIVFNAISQTERKEPVLSIKGYKKRLQTRVPR